MRLAPHDREEGFCLAREHSYNTGRIRRADSLHGSPPPARDYESRREEHDRQPAQRKKKPKRKKWPIVLTVFLVLFGLLGGTVLWAYMQVSSIMVPHEGGTIAPEHNTPEEYQGDVYNLLIVGMFREDDSVPRGMGLTDVILYANYNTRDNKLNLLQIPRDSYVGPGLGGDGKINSLLMTGADRDNPINNLVSVITNQYKLPVDGYISMDMEALKEIVDKFGGLRVYVAHRMSYKGAQLEEGWQWLNGEQVEFFVRTRKGEGFMRGDIDRLDNQRHFYSALFRRFMNMTPGDVAKLLPVFADHGSTDIDIATLISLGIKALNLQTENVMFCKVPGATDDGMSAQAGGSELYFVDANGRGTEEDPGLANLLNQYFRAFGQQYSAAELGVPNVAIPSNIALYPPNVQVMSAIQEEEGGADVNVEHTD